VECYTRGRTRSPNLLLRREAPYPIGHTSCCTHRLIAELRLGIISRQSIKRSSITGGQQTRAARAMSSPGVEPGLSWPRRDVLAARPRGNRRRRSSTSTSTSTSIGGAPTGNAFISSPARAPSLWSSALPAHHFQAAICKWRRDRHMHTAQLWGCCALWANTKTQRDIPSTENS
jgi:hypothetical protein